MFLKGFLLLIFKISYVCIVFFQIMNNATWMKTLLKGGKDPNIWEMNLIGTHHSAILWNTLDTSDSIESRFGKYKVYATLFPFIICSWTACQDYTVFEQLEMGVRYLSLSLSFTNNAFYVTHSFRGPLLTTVLDQISKFYDKYGTSEVILLRAMADPENKKTLHGKETELMQVFKNHKVSKYYTNHTSQRLFLKLSEYGNRPLIPLFDYEIQRGNVGHPNYYFRKWYNANTNKKLFERMETGFNFVKNQNISDISVLQSILTPDTSEIIRGVIFWIYFIVLAICITGISIIFSVKHDQLNPFSTFLRTHVASTVFLSIFAFIILGFSIAMIVLRPAINIKRLSINTKNEFLQKSKGRPYNVALVDFVNPDFVQKVIALNNKEESTEIQLSVPSKPSTAVK